MYLSYYQLETAPFENTPDPRFFYASDQHREALAAIEYSIRLRKGIVLVTGAIGSGKTTVARAMFKRCDKDATIVQLAHGHRSADELLGHLARMLGIDTGPDPDHAALLEALKHKLMQCAHEGRPVVLFVDEAQTLSDDALEELRLLSNFDTDTFKLLQLVLVGQPELRDRLSTQRMAPLRQRVVIARRLQPLSCIETAAYIQHRLEIASIDPGALHVRFEPGAIDAIQQFTGGLPRLINVVCDHCLLLGLVRQTPRISVEMVQRVLGDMMPSFNQINTVNPEQPRMAA
ncbi:MAG: AAA family ATPase [Planctomycetota bacterium]